MFTISVLFWQPVAVQFYFNSFLFICTITNKQCWWVKPLDSFFLGNWVYYNQVKLWVKPQMA